MASSALFVACLALAVAGSLAHIREPVKEVEKFKLSITNYCQEYVLNDLGLLPPPQQFVCSAPEHHNLTNVHFNDTALFRYSFVSDKFSQKFVLQEAVIEEQLSPLEQLIKEEIARILHRVEQILLFVKPNIKDLEAVLATVKKILEKLEKLKNILIHQRSMWNFLLIQLNKAVAQIEAILHGEQHAQLPAIWNIKHCKSQQQVGLVWRFLSLDFLLGGYPKVSLALENGVQYGICRCVICPGLAGFLKLGRYNPKENRCEMPSKQNFHVDFEVLESKDNKVLGWVDTNQDGEQLNWPLGVTHSPVFGDAYDQYFYGQFKDEQGLYQVAKLKKVKGKLQFATGIVYIDKLQKFSVLAEKKLLR